MHLKHPSKGFTAKSQALIMDSKLEYIAYLIVMED